MSVREEVHVVALDLVLELGVLLELDPDTARHGHVGVGEALRPREDVCHGKIGRASPVQRRRDVPDLEAEVIHHAAPGVSGGLPLGEYEQEVRVLDGDEWSFLNDLTSELLHPQPLIELQIGDVEVDVSERHARGVGRNQLGIGWRREQERYGDCQQESHFGSFSGIEN